MLQAIMTKPGKIEFRDVEKPIIRDDQVLVQIKRIGVCGSDIHVFHGMHPYTSYPIVQGHEVSGLVVEVGSEVEGLFPGNRVTFMPQVTCGECYPCMHGMYHICESLKVMGFQTDGAAQEFFPVDAGQVLKVPDHVSLDQLAMVEPVSVAVHALLRAGEELEGKRVLVLGAGTIGNLVAQVAKASGAGAVMITDINDYKLEKAQECGIDLVVNSGKENLGEAILRNFGMVPLSVTVEGDICGIFSAPLIVSMLIDAPICGFFAVESPFSPTSRGHCEAPVNKSGVDHPQISSKCHISGNHPAISDRIGPT